MRSGDPASRSTVRVVRELRERVVSCYLCQRAVLGGVCVRTGEKPGCGAVQPAGRAMRQRLYDRGELEIGEPECGGACCTCGAPEGVCDCEPCDQCARRIADREASESGRAMVVRSDDSSDIQF